MGEAVFLAAFLAFVLVRMANPDLWHSHLGGEKPMDMAYLNAVLKSSYMPPYDPWFGGGYINYYYWGQFMVATLVRATGIDPAIAFNLAVPLFFALTAAAAYSIVYNLASGPQTVIPAKAGIQGEGRGPHSPEPTPEPPSVRPWPARLALSPTAAGLAGAAFVVLLGNLDGAVQVLVGAWDVLVRNVPAAPFDFWRSTRVMPPDPPGHEITEFPFFTFLFGDLHAHLMALPFTLLAIGLSLAVVMSARDQNPSFRRTKTPQPSFRRKPESSRAGLGRGSRLHGWAMSGHWNPAELARLALLGLAVGSLRAINTWDVPVYLLLAAAAVFLAAYFRNGGLSLRVIAESAAKTLVVLAVGFLAFLPYHASTETFFTSVEATTNQTVLWQFLLIHGLFVFIVASHLLIDLRAHWLPSWRRLRGMAGESPARAVTLGIAGLLAAWLALTFLAGVTGSTIPFALLLLVAAAASGAKHLASRRPDARQVAFATVMVCAALGVVVGLDIFRVEGDIDRMNSVFKLYLQVWVLLALASAYLAWRILRTGMAGMTMPPCRGPARGAGHWPCWSSRRRSTPCSAPRPA